MKQPSTIAIQGKPKEPVSVCFMTVCGGGEDYDFLLGSIEHHAKMGKHVVLDTTPEGRAKKFKGLPSSVTWVHEPIYGSGWKEFKFRAALTRALEMAKEQKTDIIVELDCDEYFSEDSPQGLFPHAANSVVSMETVHWTKDMKPMSFGKGEYHTRLWPACLDVTWPVNEGWVKSPHYNGNPDHHAVMSAPPGTPHVSIPGHYHYHLHYFVGQKAGDDETARQTIHGWPNGQPARMTQLPVPIWLWKFQGSRPTEFEKFKL